MAREAPRRLARASTSARVALLALLLLLGSGRAEIVELKDQPVPPRSEPRVLYLFHVHARRDVSPEYILTDAAVEFRNFRLAGGSGPVPQRGALQIGLVPWAGDSASTEWLSRCDQAHKVKPNHYMQALVEREHVISGYAVQKSGTYALVLANCGDDETFRVSGTISVTNPYGFLPGIHAGRSTLYYTLAAGYFVSSLAWLLVLRAQPAGCQSLHYKLLGLLLTGLLESVLALDASILMNQDGRYPVTYVLSQAVWVSRVSFALGLALTIGQGPASLARSCAELRQFAWALLAMLAYAACSMVKVFMMEQRILRVSTSTAACVAPVAVVLLAIYAAVVRGITENVRELREAGRHREESLYRRTRVLVSSSVAIAGLMLLKQCGADPAGHWVFWPCQLLVNEVLPEVSFALIIGFAMALWHPSEARREDEFVDLEGAKPVVAELLSASSDGDGEDCGFDALSAAGAEGDGAGAGGAGGVGGAVGGRTGELFDGHIDEEVELESGCMTKGGRSRSRILGAE